MTALHDLQLEYNWDQLINPGPMSFEAYTMILHSTLQEEHRRLDELKQELRNTIDTAKTVLDRAARRAAR